MPDRSPNDLVFYVRRQDDAGLNRLACAIMNAPGMTHIMNTHVPHEIYVDGVMLNDTEADTWASPIDKSVAYTWLRDSLLYFCHAHPQLVNIGIDRIESDEDTHDATDGMARDMAYLVKVAFSL